MGPGGDGEEVVADEPDQVTAKVVAKGVPVDVGAGDAVLADAAAGGPGKLNERVFVDEGAEGVGDAERGAAAAAAREGDPEHRGDGVRGLMAAPILWLIPAIQGSWTALCSVMLPCRILVSPCESLLEPCEPLWMIFGALWAF